MRALFRTPPSWPSAFSYPVMRATLQMVLVVSDYNATPSKFCYVETAATDPKLGDHCLLEGRERKERGSEGRQMSGGRSESGCEGPITTGLLARRTGNAERSERERQWYDQCENGKTQYCNLIVEHTAVKEQTWALMLKTLLVWATGSATC